MILLSRGVKRTLGQKRVMPRWQRKRIIKAASSTVRLSAVSDSLARRSAEQGSGLDAGSGAPLSALSAAFPSTERARAIWLRRFDESRMIRDEESVVTCALIDHSCAVKIAAATLRWMTGAVSESLMISRNVRVSGPKGRSKASSARRYAFRSSPEAS